MRNFVVIALAIGLALAAAWLWIQVPGPRSDATIAKAVRPSTLGGSSEPAPDERAGWPDSFKYYGPGGLWKSWSPSQRFGRDTWIFWTGGNQKFLRLASQLAGQLPTPISIEFFRMLDSRNRYERFRKFGLINEPNCDQSSDPDEFGLYLDKWAGDPLHYYPSDPKYYADHPDYYAADPKVYGEPTGIVGLRKFPNPRFDRSKWNVADYFNNPGRIEPPYLMGFSCAFCHIAFDPNNPPKDPERPRWENLAANMGNQYLREGDLFVGRGRIVFGDRNPGPNRANNPYDTKGLDTSSFLFHYANTQQPGTSETSRISYDFINNPNTMNSIFYLGSRPLFAERSPDGQLRLVNHILKDGSDSVGVEMAVLRVWINIGCEGRYWIDTLYNPATGQRQRPLDLDELGLNVSPARLAELKEKYGNDVGQDWAEAHRRNPHLVGYLASYGPYHLQDAPGGAAYLTKDAAQLERGKAVYAKHCAECHSNKQPFYSQHTPEQKARFFHDSVLSPIFLANNTLSDDKRYSVLELGTNMARALATNAVDGDVWAELSSQDYKALPPLGTLRLSVPVFPDAAPITLDFTPPGGGRGYYRTPSLVSLWATAPYLHNNALGDYCVVRGGAKVMVPNDGQIIDDPIDTSVEGRMKMFQDGIEKMLWPDKRRYYIKRTQTDSQLIDLLPLVQALMPGAVEEWLADFLARDVTAVVDKVAEEKRLAAPKVTALKDKLVADARTGLANLRSHLATQNVTLIKEQLGVLVKDKIAAKAATLANADFGADLKARLGAIAEKVTAEAVELLSQEFLKIPKGTPVNLYFNLHANALPYALKAQIKYRKDPRKLAETLLMLSDCPDLVEDKGHTYGSQLSEQEKRDLIEFLKTL
jgi:hypothetical protein